MKSSITFPIFFSHNCCLEQREILLQTPTLLNAFLTVAIARNWISPVLYVMRLHAYFAQALLPASGDGSSRLRFAQLPGIQPDEVQLSGDLATEAEDYDEFVQALEEKSDSRLPDVKKAMNTWGRLDLVDLNYKGETLSSFRKTSLMRLVVIGERIVTPSSFVFLVLKLRVLPPLNGPPKVDVEDIKAKIKSNEEKDYKFLTATSEAEDLVSEDATVGWAHAPYWPAVSATIKAPALFNIPARRTENQDGGSLSQMKRTTVWLSLLSKSPMFLCLGQVLIRQGITAPTNCNSRLHPTLAS